MKLVRFISEDDRVLCGLYEEELPAEPRIIEGDIFGEFSIGRERARIRHFLPPVAPCNILAIGLNYRRHADETGLTTPPDPVLFIKAATSAVGHGEPVLLPLAGPDRVDYEAELAVIIGKGGKNISVSAAMEHVLGYACSNDISARDWQMDRQSKQWARGKSFDTFCPLGPFLVTRDEVPDPSGLRIRAIINGNTLQDGNTSAMIFDVPALISNLSRSMTLLPGTVIMTGTPEGVGFTRTPPVFLHDGDVVTVDIEKIGRLTNPVRSEAAFVNL
jgi:2-keto-4-pentenoate hydratase/2-oxohepta-3-ene-1,7-dioic acid hydratase in catechol pathway